MDFAGVNFIDSVISTLNRLSGIIQQSDDLRMDESSQKDPSFRPNLETLKKNDIYYTIGRQSGALKRKHRPHLIQTIDELAKSRRVSLGDRCYLGCQLIPNRRLRKNMIRYFEKAYCGTFENDGNLFITAAQDSVIRIYESSNDQPTPKRTIRATQAGWSILDTAVSPDGNFLVYSSWSDNLYLSQVHDLIYENAPLKLNPLDNRFCVFSLKFSANGEEILCGASDSALYIYSLTAQTRTLRIPVHGDEVNAVCFADQTSHILFTGGDDGLVKVWDRRVLDEARPRPAGVFAGHRNGITYIDSKGDGRYLISNSKDQSIKLWDVRCFASAQGIEATRKAVADQQWDYRWQPVPSSQSGPNIAQLPGDVSVLTNRRHIILQTLIRCRFSPAFTTGQRYIYSGCAHGRVVIYDILTGKQKEVLSAHRACVRDVSWHPFAPIIKSTSFDGTVREWMYRSETPVEFFERDPEQDVLPNPRRTFTRQRLEFGFY